MFPSKIFGLILDLVLPRRCLGCNKNGTNLCHQCLSSVAPSDKEEEWILSRFSYQDPVMKESIWRLKYKGAIDIGEKLGLSLAEVVMESMEDLSLFQNWTNPVVIPTPLSRSRARERGFNQALTIAESLASEIGWEVSSTVLYKIKDTDTQVSIKDRTKRLRNLKGAFQVQNLESIKGRNILLIDDVYTTGATMRECRLTLESAGSGKVLGATVAH